MVKETEVIGKNHRGDRLRHIPSPIAVSSVATDYHLYNLSPVGFEPTTPRLKGECSTRLSYGLK